MPLEQVEEPRDAFDRAVLEPGVGGQIEIAFRHRSVERVGTMQVLPAGLQHQRGGDRNAGAVRPEGRCCAACRGLRRSLGRTNLAEADFAAKAALARPSAERTSRRELMVHSFGRVDALKVGMRALPQCQVFAAVRLRGYRRGALLRKRSGSPAAASQRTDLVRHCKGSYSSTERAVTFS